MNIREIMRAAVLAVSLAFTLAVSGIAHAFVGTIAVGLSQMNDEVGPVQTSFAADAKLETEEMTTVTRVYYKPGSVRDEINMGGQSMVTIRNLETDMVYMLMPQGMYMEVDGSKGSEQATDYKLISREVIGPETINGMQTVKYKSVYESKDGKFGGFTWYTDDNIAVKGFLIHESKGEKQRIKFEFTNLERGAQPDTLFEIPDGYRKLDMGGFGGMKGMGQMGGAGVPGGQLPAGMPGSSQPAGAQSNDPAAKESEKEGGFVQEVAEESQQTAEDTAKQETKREIQDKVRKGIGKLFGR